MLSLPITLTTRYLYYHRLTPLRNHTHTHNYNITNTHNSLMPLHQATSPPTSQARPTTVRHPNRHSNNTNPPINQQAINRNWRKLPNPLNYQIPSPSRRSRPNRPAQLQCQTTPNKTTQDISPRQFNRQPANITTQKLRQHTIRRQSHYHENQPQPSSHPNRSRQLPIRQHQSSPINIRHQTKTTIPQLYPKRSHTTNNQTAKNHNTNLRQPSLTRPELPSSQKQQFHRK